VAVFRRKPSQSWAFASRRPVKNDPGRKIACEILEAMFDVGGDEQSIAGGKTGTLAIDDEFAGTANHEIDFIAIVRLLRVVIERGIKFDDETAVAKCLDEAFALRPFRRSRPG
jgi:hypothetical protein